MSLQDIKHLETVLTKSGSLPIVVSTIRAPTGQTFGGPNTCETMVYEQGVFDSSEWIDYAERGSKLFHLHLAAVREFEHRGYGQVATYANEKRQQGSF